MALDRPYLAQEGINLILECAAVLAEFIGRGEHLNRGPAGVPGGPANAGNIVRHLWVPSVACCTWLAISCMATLCCSKADAMAVADTLTLAIMRVAAAPKTTTRKNWDRSCVALWP